MFYINSLNILHKIRVAKNTKGFLPAELSSIFVFSGALLTREVEFQAWKQKAEAFSQHVENWGT